MKNPNKKLPKTLTQKMIMIDSAFPSRHSARNAEPTAPPAPATAAPIKMLRFNFMLQIYAKTSEMQNLLPHQLVSIVEKLTKNT